MGYFVEGKKIAKINPKADVVSLSANPNFVQFESEYTEPETEVIPPQTYMKSILTIDLDAIYNRYTDVNDYGAINSMCGTAVISIREVPSFKEYHLTFRIEGYCGYTGINVTQENFPEDIVLDMDYKTKGLAAFVRQMKRRPEFADYYEIEEVNGSVVFTAKTPGENNVITSIGTGGFSVALDWFQNNKTGYYEATTCQLIIATPLTSTMHEQIEKPGTEIVRASKPFEAKMEKGQFVGYDFEPVDKLPDNITTVKLSVDDKMKSLEAYIATQNTRFNPYEAYYEVGVGQFFRFVNYTRFVIQDKLNEIDRWFQGIDPIMKVSGAYETSDYSYQLSDDPVVTIQNLREALLKCPFIRDNFKVSLPVEVNAETSLIRQMPIIDLKSLQIGMRFNFEIVLNKEKNENNVAEYEAYKAKFDEFMQINQSNYISVNPDAINEGAEACEIHLDLYTNTDVFLGEADNPNIDDLGTYVTTLTKSYSNQPVWFDLNSIQTKKYEPPFGVIDAACGLNKSDRGVWFDAATYSDRRFVAKRVTPSASESFYYSLVLYTLTGFDRNLNANDLKKYVLEADRTSIPKSELIYPLTLQPAVSHVKGQMQYFNFILKDNSHSDNDSLIGVEYELLTQSGAPIGEPVADHQLACSKLNVAIP